MIDPLLRAPRLWVAGAALILLSSHAAFSQNQSASSSNQSASSQNQSAAQGQSPASHAAGQATAAQWAKHVQQIDAQAPVPDRTAMLRGAYGPFRANNDLLYYHLDVRVNPEEKSLQGKNTIRFRMLEDGTRIQLDLQEPLQIDKIVLGGTELKYERDSSAVFIDFPETLRKGQVFSIDFYSAGKPQSTGRFGGITFKTDPAGHVWINTACEGDGASVWWPNK